MAKTCSCLFIEVPIQLSNSGYKHTQSRVKPEELPSPNGGAMPKPLATNLYLFVSSQLKELCEHLPFFHHRLDRTGGWTLLLSSYHSFI